MGHCEATRSHFRPWAGDEKEKSSIRSHSDGGGGDACVLEWGVE